MGQILPGVNTTTITSVRHLVDNSLTAHGSDVVLDSGNTDSGSTPTYRFRPGNVVILRTSTGRYVEANDANADVSTAAAKSTSGHTDGNGVIEIVSHAGTISVTTSTGSGTEANNATDLNADAAFKAHFIATSGGGELTITSRLVGSGAWFYITSNTTTNGWSEGVGITGLAKGTDPDVRVTDDFADLEVDGTAVHAPVRTLLRGHFDESELINLTAEARAVLSKRGSLFG